jgi:hypothetical protein
MIYTITSLIDKEGDEIWDLSNRTFGYYFHLSDAIKAVEENRGDIQECLYTHVVIEGLKEGIHPDIVEEVWFEWNKEQKKWVRLEEEPKISDFCNWAMG